MGKEENIHAAADLTGLHTASLMLQEQVRLFRWFKVLLVILDLQRRHD